MSDEQPDLSRTCHDCRHVSKSKRPKIVDATGFDDQMEFSDDDEVVYTCMATRPSLEIGPVPKKAWVPTLSSALDTCPLWAVPVKITSAKQAELDSFMARFNERMGHGDKDR